MALIFLKERMRNILSNMSMVDRKRIEMGLTFPENTAGGLLNTDVISVRPSNSIKEVISYLRDLGKLPDNTDKIFVVNLQIKSTCSFKHEQWS